MYLYINIGKIMIRAGTERDIEIEKQRFDDLVEAAALLTTSAPKGQACLVYD
jgi:hypothetical protein